MRGFPAIASSESHRVRRWDAVVMGTALPGLVAAACIARAGRRVLLIEEACEGAVFKGLREPFHLGGTGPDHVLGGMLRELAIPLIDQRLLVPQSEGLQVALPDARIDIGPSSALVGELADWQLATPEESLGPLRAIEEAGARERRALLLSPLVRAGRRLPFSAARIARGRAATEEEAGRGMPRALAEGPASLRLLCDVLVRALGNHAARAPSSEASARLLGSALEGSHFVAGGQGLQDILERRLAALGVERRTLPGELRFVSVAGQPGLSPSHSDEIWTGRCMLWNAPLCALGAATEGDLPEPLETHATHERVSLHFRTRRELLPQSMGDRVVAVGNPADPTGDGLVCIRSFAGEAETANLVASAVVEKGSEPEQAIEQSVRALLPFSGDSLETCPVPRPRWDQDRDLEDPPDGGGWPRELEVRVCARPNVYALDRRAIAGLGFEGDLLLGWRAGELIAAGLA
jgi:hypothetical protein